mmetsp:Transcript_19957/g.22961  ORF Transcript_19957/g.22961 Transcript_19957/m.22961 type:complete len:155 (+) Transcript_19957:60-524(+)
MQVEVKHEPRHEQNKFVHYMLMIIRPCNFIGGVGTIATAVFYLLFVGINFVSILNLYFTALLGVLLLAGELNLTVINENCKFLITLLGRGFFDVFVGGWVYSLNFYFYAISGSLIDELSYFVSYVTYLALWVIGIFFIVMHFMGKSKFIYDVKE